MPAPLKLLQMVYRGHNGAPNAERIFATPQRSIAEYYANKRVAQHGGYPAVESLLIDPFAGERYGHSIPLDDLNREVRMTRAVELRPEDIVEKYAKGGLAKYPQPYTHTRSSTQDKSIEQMDAEGFAALKRGAKRWLPDLVALPGDLADAIAYAGSKIAQGQKQQSIPSLGAGPAIRRAVIERIGTAKSAPTLPEMTATPETDWREESAAMLNPLFFMNPATSLKIAAGAMGAPEMGALGVIKNKGGNWLTGSVEDALRGLKDELIPLNAHAYRPETVNRANALNSFIDKQLTRYVKNEMATPEDPIRALAERGVLHFEPGWIPEPAFSRGVAARLTKGQSGRELGQSPRAKDWEALTDQGLDQEFADEVVGGLRGQNPWLEKVPRDAPVYSMPRDLPESLGFNHLIDELSNALNPESGLPRHLLLDPKSMERVSVPQAVERVSQINAWRAAQKAEADALRANNAATVLHKEYAENNPKGLRWVELRQPKELPEGWKYMEKSGNYVMPDGTITGTGPGERSLQDALRYEGDTMGHCVGGYCDDVLSGRSRIFSLRDAKGQPHVTVEVAPDADWKNKLFEASRRGNAIDEMFGERAPEIRAAFNASPFNNIQQFLEKNPQYLPESNRIVQIKGKQNRAPNAEYLPFVQDFVRSGKWSDVGDLQNTGLRRSRDIWNDLEQQKIREAGHDFGEYVSPEEKKAIVDAVWPGQWGEYATGGSVTLDHFRRALK
jgi:hypothetical protein